jgi:hypothetical protein
MPEYCDECCGEILTFEERDLLYKRFIEAHRKGSDRFGVDWLKANRAAVDAAHDLNIDPSHRKIQALLSQVCFFILARFENERSVNDDIG